MRAVGPMRYLVPVTVRSFTNIFGVVAIFLATLSLVPNFICHGVFIF